MLDDLESYEELVTFNNDIASFESDFTFQGDLLGAQVPEFFTVWSSGTFSNFEQVSVGAGEKPGNGKTPSALDPMLQALWAGQQPTIAARSNEGAKSANNHAEGPYQFFGEYVVVDVRAQDGMAQDLLAELEGLGLRSGAAFGNIVSGLMPVMSLGDLESAEHIRYASASLMKTNVGAVTQQGDAAMQSDAARTTFDVDGTGLTIGTLSDSYDDLGGAVLGVGTGDLPNNVVVLEDLGGSGSDEGRAMIELIFDVAPGADQLFHTAFLGQANFAQGIIDLQNAGADIIVDDVFYFAEPFFQDGIIAQAVDQVVENGALYFSSAGNSGRDSWEDGFRASAETISGISGTLHDFDSGAGDDARMNITLANGSSILLSFQWDEPFAAAGGAGSASDVDIFLLEAGTDTIVAASAADNIANGDPVEIFSFTNTTGSTQSYDIVISLFAGAAPGLMKFIDFDGVATYNEYFTFSSTVVGHSNAVGANAIGASAFFFTPEFGQNPPILNNFSSFGTTPIFFEDDGTRLATEEVRTGPVFTAPDGGNTTFFGSDSGADADAFPNFFGTSAAAPNAAAAAALMKEAVPEATNAQIIQALSETAIDIVQTSDGVALSAGSDIGSGAGLIQVDAAIVRLMELVNTPPDAQNDLVTTDEDTAFSGNVLAGNGNGADNDADGDTLTITALNGEAMDVNQEVTLASGALLTLNDDGTFDYNPNGQFESLAVGETDTDSFSYTVSDDNGGTDTATVTITINGVNDAPVAQDDLVVTDEDTAFSGSVFANNGNAIDGDVDATDTLAVTAVNGQAVDIGQQTILASGALLTLNSDGTFSYDPNGQFEYLSVKNILSFEERDTFLANTISVQEESFNTVMDELSFGDEILEFNGLSLQVTGTDTSGADRNIIDLPPAIDPVFSIDGSNFAYVTLLESDNSLTIEFDDPITSFGADFGSFNDGAAQSTVKIDGIVVDVPLVPSGTVRFFGVISSTPFTTIEISRDIQADRFGLDNLVFGQADENVVGVSLTSDTFTYSISDGNGATDTAIATVNINGVNDAPTISGDLFFVVDEGGTFALSTSDFVGADVDDNLSVLTYEVSNLLNGVIQVSGQVGTTFTQAELANGEVRFIHDGSETPNAGFDVFVSDDGNASSGTFTITGNVILLNDAPVAQDDDVSTDEDTVLSDDLFTDNGNGIDFDPDGDSVTAFSVNGLEANVGQEITLASGALLTVNADGTFTYDPNGQFESLAASETDTDSFVYGLTDGNFDIVGPGTFFNPLELSSLVSGDGSNGFIINGANAYDQFGYAVSNAGDVNGDGIADIIVAANYADPNGVATGAGYVVFGTSDFSTNFKLSSIDGSNGFIIAGINVYDRVGTSVSTAGDVNGDGIDDVIVGARSADPNGSKSGQSYVVFGSSEAISAQIELSDLDGSNGFVLNGVDAYDESGVSVSDAGDLNGDGIDDLIIGALFADPNGANSGESYVVFGSTDTFSASLELSDLDGENGFTINGVDAGGKSGFSVASAGDFNADGIDDIIIGAPDTDQAGESYVVFGTTDRFSAVLELSDLDGTSGFAIIGADSRSGVDVHSVGDVNGDGIDDIIIGDPSGRSPVDGSIGGESYVVFGSSSSVGATLHLSTLDGSNGFVLQGVDSSDYSGFAASAAGDINGDGVDDILIGARFADPNGNESGESYVVFGSTSGFSATFELSSINGINGFRIIGINAGDESGVFVSAAGDINNDGFDDLIIGAPFADSNGDRSGQSYVIYGRAEFEAVVDTATVTVTVNGVNDGPVFDDLTVSPLTLNEEGVVTVDGTFLDPDLSDTHTVTIDWGDGSASTVIDLTGGERSFEAMHQYVDDDPSGTSSDDYTISFSIVDSNSGSDSTTRAVTVSNVAPVAADDEASTNEDTAVVIAVLDNDIDVEADSLTINSIDTTDTIGVVTDNGDGTVTYDPNGQFELLADGEITMDTFTYTVSDDDTGVSNTAIVTVTLNGVNDVPEAQDDAFTTSESASVSGNLLDDNGSGADVDDDSPSLLVSAINGDSELVGEEIELSSGALLTLGSDGSFTYDPNGRFEQLASGGTGADSFSYTISDGQGGSDTALVMISVNGENDAPTLAGDLTIAVTEGQSVLLSISDITGSDVDNDSALLIYTVSNLLNGSIRINDQSVSTFSQTDLEGGNVFFVHDGSEAETASFDVFVEDDNGAPSDTSTVEAIVQAVNDAPTLSGDGTVFVLEGETVILDVSDFVAADVDDELSSLTYEISNLVGGLVQVSGLVQNIFSQSDLDAGLVSFVHDGSEAPKASFNVAVKDDELASSPSLTVDVLVTPQNDFPIAFADAFNIQENRILAGNLFADNGSGPDIDVDFDDLTIVSVSLNGEAFSAGEQIELSSGALLIVNQDGTFAYDTNGAFDALEFRQLQSETDAIEYTITDGFAFGTASIEITILGVNNNIINGTFRAETISGSGVGDDIFGRGGDDIINGGNGNDLLEGNGGRDEINGGDGNDELIGGDGGDRLFGGDGDDIISGRRGSDFIQAGAGNDDVAGRGLRDVIFGGSGDDTLRGNGGQDELFGEKGNDRLVGGQGNDFLFGGDDNDFLDGRAGDDVLNGGSGEDILRGSKGADTFIFEAGHEIADIVDFQNNEDLLDLTSYGFETLDEAISNMEQDGFDVIFAVGSDRLTVSSITVGELQDDILI